MGSVRVYSEVLGDYVIVPDEPKRIASLAPAITETLFMLGLGDRVVAVSLHCMKPREAMSRPKAGSYYKVNYSVLEEVQPDLVLTTTGAQLRVSRELREKGYVVFPLPLPNSIYGILDNIVKIGMITGTLRIARRLSLKLLEAIKSVAGRLEGVRIYYEIDLGGPVSGGAFTYITDAFEIAGAKTAFGEEKTTWVLNPSIDLIREFNPEVIIYEPSSSTSISREGVQRMMIERGLDRVDAVLSGRLLVLEPDTLAHYGPSFFSSLKKIVSTIEKLLD